MSRDSKGARTSTLERGPWFVRGFRRMSLLKKTVIVNSAVVLLGAVAGTYVTKAMADRQSGLSLTLLFFASGACITILVNYLGFWDHFRPLVELSRAIEAIQRGREGRVAIHRESAADMSGVVDSISTILDRIEDQSLHYSARLLGSIEAERQRIGRELHDDTSQMLAAALLKLGLAERSLPDGAAGVRETLEMVRDLINKSLDQIKTVIYDIRPSMLDDLGLVAALSWYIKARVETTGLEVFTRFDERARRLPSAIETALYRIGQEALANAVKHAGATRVDIGLEIKPGYAVLTVFDNGRGFDPSQARGQGLGLFSMQERVEQHGGQFNIVSDEGRGTRVYAVVPLPEIPTAGEESRP